MQALGHRRDDSWSSFCQRRGISDPTRFDLDLTRTAAVSGGAAGSGSYPSPPMSGSPPLPPKTSHEGAERSPGTYQAISQDVYRGIATTQSGETTRTGIAGASRPLLSGTPERASYPFPRLEASSAIRALPYSQQLGEGTAQPAAGYLPLPVAGPAATHTGPLPAPVAYAASSYQPIPDALSSPPPKPQRKTKGHVASACVPCKKAHLRCDAQRPCSRCISTNKESACVDVQHKKRGRPRLRDDSQMKYEATRFGNAPDSIRRPLSLSYAPGTSPGTTYDDNLRRTQSYRVLKSQPTEPIAPRFPQRGLASDANIYPAPLSISTARTSEEPVAFLTLSLEFSKESASFLNAVGRSSVAGLKLANVLVAEDRAKADRLQQQAQEERTRKAPSYLPPIFNERSEVVMQGLSFASEEVSRYPLPWLDTFTFLGDDGQARPYPIRAGLATRDSIYFVVLLLNRMLRPTYPTPSPSLRDTGGSLDPALQSYSQPTPLSATFDLRHSRLGDTAYEPRQTGPSVAPLHIMAGRSPGLPSTYAASPSRPDYPITPNTYHTPRSEVYPAPRLSQGAEYQFLPLPRIRSPPLGHTQQLELPPPPPPPPRTAPPPSYQSREERSRIGIGGLLEEPEQPGRNAGQQLPEGQTGGKR